MTYDPFKISAIVPDFAAVVAGYGAASEAARAKHRNIQDVAYGDGPRQRLDLFFPAELKAPAPVHMFLHGGYWRANSREDYAFVAETIVANGAIAAIVEYTLMPRARMSQLVGEARQAAGWLRAHIDEYGGDKNAMSASGHSAGAHLASYLSAIAPHEHGFPGAEIKALLLLSGIYDLRPITTSFLQPELSLTPEEVNEWSPFEATQAAGTHVTLAVGHDESEPFHLQAQDFAFAAERRGTKVERITVPGLNHMSIVRDLGVPGDADGGFVGGDDRAVAA